MGTDRLGVKIFRAVDAWKRLGDGGLVRYRCFEVLPGGGFCVQSADFYPPDADEATVRSFDRQYLELLAEQEPDVRSGTYDTLEEAIRRHEQDFEEFDDDDRGGG